MGCVHMPRKSDEKRIKDAYTKGVFSARLRRAKEFRNMKNKDIVKRSQELGFPMSESTVCQYMKGRFVPRQDRLYIWSEIFDINVYWLMGIGSIDHIISNSYESEQQKYLEEISQIFFKLNPDHQFLLLRIARELLTSVKNIKNKYE